MSSIILRCTIIPEVLPIPVNVIQSHILSEVAKGMI